MEAVRHPDMRNIPDVASGNRRAGALPGSSAPVHHRQWGLGPHCTGGCRRLRGTPGQKHCLGVTATEGLFPTLFPDEIPVVGHTIWHRVKLRFRMPHPIPEGLAVVPANPLQSCPLLMCWRHQVMAQELGPMPSWIKVSSS